MSTRNLDKLFDPKSIAVIGASNKKGSVGYILLRNLIGAEYEGIVYPVNVSAQSVQGIQAYASISQVPRKIDLAIIAVPAKAVLETMRECGEAGVAGAVIVSSGFKEIGAKGRKLEIHTVPMPAIMEYTADEVWGVDAAEGSIPRQSGDKTAASYLNFLIVNDGIILPTFGDPNDDVAREIVAGVFPERRIVTVPGREIVLGGGNVHCITQQQPRG